MTRLGLLILVLGIARPCHAQPGPLPAHPTAEDVYRAACVTCHGADGKGSPASTLGFATPLPDFTDCAFATAEPDPDWHAVVNRGGPIRGLNRHMPSFGEALSAEHIALALGHVRSFCTDPAWPRGDLNLPRAFFTEKAFPENEAVWAASFSTRGDRDATNELIYERRIGPRNQLELKVPIAFLQDATGSSSRGLGDIALAFKRTLHANVRRGGIASAGLEVVMPTGRESTGLGGGDTVLEPFAMWGQILPRNAFLQFHAGAELPAGSNAGPKEVFVRSAIGTTLAQDRGFGRAWSPQVELLWARPQGGASEWDLVPQIQVTLSKLQHVSLAAGARVPLTERGERSTQGLVYLLWDWFDGGFFDGWK